MQVTAYRRRNRLMCQDVERTLPGVIGRKPQNGSSYQHLERSCGFALAVVSVPFLEQLWCPSAVDKIIPIENRPENGGQGKLLSASPRPDRSLADVCAGRENPNREGAPRNARNGAYSRQKLALTAIQSGILAKEELPLFREALRAGEALGRAFRKVLR